MQMYLHIKYVNPILTLHDNKRVKQDNLKSSYMWHFFLGHINERRMVELHKNGILGSLDYESYNTRESCLLGKIRKLSFKGKGESYPLILLVMFHLFHYLH